MGLVGREGREGEVSRKAGWYRLMTIFCRAGPASCGAEDPFVRHESGGEGGWVAEEEVMGWEDMFGNCSAGRDCKEGYARW